MANSDQTRLAEISAADATGNTALIYGAIETALGVRLVNLVYRHIATVPGALEWTWAVLSHPFEQDIFARKSGTLVEIASGSLSAAEKPNDSIALSADLSDQDFGRIVGTIDGYNRANPMNALSLNVVALALEDRRVVSCVQRLL